MDPKIVRGLASSGFGCTRPLEPQMGQIEHKNVKVLANCRKPFFGEPLHAEHTRGQKVRQLSPKGFWMGTIFLFSKPDVFRGILLSKR